MSFSKYLHNIAAVCSRKQLLIRWEAGDEKANMALNGKDQCGEAEGCGCNYSHGVKHPNEYGYFIIIK